MKLSLPNIGFLKKKAQKEFFLGLLFAPNKIGAILFENVNGTLQVITSFEEDEKDIDKLTTEELISAADRVITSIETSLPKNVELRKTIFAVPYTWQEDAKIDQAHLLELKKMCEELDLVPLGFLIGIEAMIHFLKTKEGAPVTAIFIELYTDRVFVFLVKNNNLVEVKDAPIGDSVVHTVDGLLKTSTQFEVLPARIFLQNERKSEHVQQEFLSHNWSKDLPFIHEPQVIVFEKGFENEAIINGVAQQMGIDVLGDVSDLPKAQALDTADKSEDLGNPEQAQSMGEEFGFFKEKDVKFEQDQEKEDAMDEKQDLEDSEPDDGIQNEIMNDSVDGQKENPLTGIISYVFQLTAAVKNLPITTFPKKLLKGSSKGLGIKIALLLIPVIIVLGLFVYLYYSYILKANVIVFLDKKTVNQNVSVTFSNTQNTSASNNIVHINTTSQQLSENTSITTTGKKVTGNKAKGTVTLYNKTQSPVTISQGTALVGPSGLNFQTLNDVQIASTSSFSTSFSSSDVDVQASDFGTQYNLPSDSNFTVQNISSSDVFGKNNTAFSGGTKNDLQVVSQQDVTNLTNQAMKDLEKKALSSLSSSSDSTPLPVVISATFNQKKFDHAVGDQTNTLGLSASMNITTGNYSTNEIQNFAKGLAQGTIPNDYAYLASESHIGVSGVANNNGVVSGTLQIKAVFLPRIDLASIKQGIVKKPVNSAQTYLKGVSGVQDDTILFSNKLPLLPSFLPWNSNNITITLKSNG